MLYIQDITERKRIEESLLKSKYETTVILNNISERVSYLDTDLRIIYANRADCEHIGLGPDELFGRHCYDVCWKRTEPCENCPAVSTLETGLPQEKEKTSSDGTTRLIRTYPVFDNIGKIKGIVEVSQDISLRKQAKDELQYRVKMEKLIASISTRFINLDIEEIDAGINYTLQVLSEFSKIDRSYVFLFSEDNLYINNTHEWCAERIEPKFNFIHEMPVDSTSRWLEKLRRFETIHIPDAGEMPREEQTEKEILGNRNIKSIVVVPLSYRGTLLGFLGFNTYTTKKVWTEEDINLLQMAGEIISNAIKFKSAEKALEFEHAQLLSIFDSVNAVIYVSDPVTYEILYVNKYLRELHDRDPVGGICYKLFQNLDRPCDFCTNDIILNNKEKSYQWEHHNSSINSDYMISDRIIKWPDGRDVRFELAIDITEWKRLENQFLQAQKMETVGRLAGGIAHDFNNLLTVIMGNVEVALLQSSPDSPILNEIEEIKKSAIRASNLTRQLLAFSRRQLIEPQNIDLNNVIAEMDKMLRRLIKEDIELTTKLSKPLWTLKVDPGQIEQVLTNLVINARDAMPDGGKLIIETANVSLDKNYVKNHPGTKPGDYVLMAVTDTGTGMDEKTQLKIFEPFFTTKEIDKGTGLGLSTCYGIVKQNGGNIWVYSEPGHGTSIKIYLPKVEDEPISIPSPEKKIEPLAGTETILVVEDDKMLRKMVVRMLHDNGYTVLEAQNGVEAFEIVKNDNNCINLVITDLIMPYMGGKELYKQINKIKPDLKILIMSGYTNNNIDVQNIPGPEFKFLQKPFSSISLAEKVRNLLDS